MIDVAVVGAGAAGLFAATFAARAGARVVALDGAATLGAKILVAGGGRCNVTHERVAERDFNGGTPAAIRKVLRRFDVAETIAFFGAQGVALKREETGKLFPVTDRARTVLDALLRAARDAGAEVAHPRRVERLAPLAGGGGFEVGGPWGTLTARRVVLATGGMSLPKSGSDGHGFALARGLGHTTTPRIFPALVPLVLEASCPLRGLAGISADVAVEVRGGTGRRIVRMQGSLLLTHFGLSGPAALDVSRHLLAARHDDPGAALAVAWLPEQTAESADRALQAQGAASAGRWLRGRLPDRLAAALCAIAGVDASAPVRALPRERRRALAALVAGQVLPVVGDRGFTHAEVTAGGVPLSETRLETLESRVAPGLHLCGEILDVDGHIGGFNFQWAWASGFVAGSAAGEAAVRV